MYQVQFLPETLQGGKAVESCQEAVDIPAPELLQAAEKAKLKYELAWVKTACSMRD